MEPCDRIGTARRPSRDRAHTTRDFVTDLADASVVEVRQLYQAVTAAEGERSRSVCLPWRDRERGFGMAKLVVTRKKQLQSAIVSLAIKG